MKTVCFSLTPWSLVGRSQASISDFAFSNHGFNSSRLSRQSLYSSTFLFCSSYLPNANRRVKDMKHILLLHARNMYIPKCIMYRTRFFWKSGWYPRSRIKSLTTPRKAVHIHIHIQIHISINIPYAGTRWENSTMYKVPWQHVMLWGWHECRPFLIVIF